MCLPAGKILLDEATLREIIDQMRLAVPDEAVVGQRIATERERIWAEAKTHARRITEEAHAQANSSPRRPGRGSVARQRAREDSGAEAELKANALRAGRDGQVRVLTN